MDKKINPGFSNNILVPTKFTTTVGNWLQMFLFSRVEIPLSSKPDQSCNHKVKTADFPKQAGAFRRIFVHGFDSKRKAAICNQYPTAERAEMSCWSRAEQCPSWAGMTMTSSAVQQQHQTFLCCSDTALGAHHAPLTARGQQLLPWQLHWQGFNLEQKQLPES